MNPVHSSVLLLDDDAQVCAALQRLDVGPGMVLHACGSVAEADLLVARLQFDVVLVDRHLAAGDPRGIDYLAGLMRRDPDCFRVIFTGAADLDFTVEAINRGLIDAFLPKPWVNEQVVSLLHNGCETALLRRHNRSLVHELGMRNTELLEFNLRLEQLVDERTANLREANAGLRAAHDRLQEKQRELVRLETQGAVAQLVRGLAHELNNPLASILGYAQRLRRTWASDPEVVRRLDVILAEVDRCSSLVDQLRNLAAPLDEQPQPCRLDEILARAGNHRAEQGLAVPELRVAADLPQVMAGPRSLERVFAAVIDNADAAGARSMWLSATRAGSEVKATIANDGEAPGDEALRNAVRPFYTTWSSTGHRGLGLAIAASLLRDQGGTIALTTATVSTARGGGAATVLTLPAHQRPVSARLMAVRGTAVPPVLVVDDEPLVAELLIDALQEHGVPAVSAASIAAALDVVARQTVRAVIADLHLPDGSGDRLIAQVVARRPELGGHVALLTGDGDRIQAGGPPLLAKPFRIDEVTALIDRIL